MPVIVLATGFRSYVPRRGEYGYRNFKEVITLPDLIRILAEEKTGGEKSREKDRRSVGKEGEKRTQGGFIRRQDRETEGNCGLETKEMT